MDIPGVGGAQILDETGSNKAIRQGHDIDERLYGITTWDASNNISDNFPFVSTLNEAKQLAKEDLIKKNRA